MALLIFYSVISLTLTSDYTYSSRDTYVYDNSIALKLLYNVNSLEVANKLGYCGQFYVNNAQISSTCDCASPMQYFPCDAGVCGIRLCKRSSS